MLCSQTKGEAWLMHSSGEFGSLESFFPPFYERKARWQDQIAPHLREEIA